MAKPPFQSARMPQSTRSSPGRKLLFGGPFEHHREAIVVPRLEAAVRARFLAPLLEPRLHAGISNVTGDGVFGRPGWPCRRHLVDTQSRQAAWTQPTRRGSIFSARSRDFRASSSRPRRCSATPDADVQRRITGSHESAPHGRTKALVRPPIAQRLPADLGRAGRWAAAAADEPTKAGKSSAARRTTRTGALQQRDDGFVA